ncbi:hypothetical protein MPTK1_1g20660 [Marchantia polymorpha subsp. ruderalis]|uniref:Uncharacterized protein n=1 Tax=Marchantia polymorpha subsp. ruderalis TaxID=1480154 RepID=A0AAF6ASD0_MARPO|nr:hypothetical protein Mp_1g20660 [Marchantia polymorpha subsp. ruderalis]
MIFEFLSCYHSRLSFEGSLFTHSSVRCGTLTL